MKKSVFLLVCATVFSVASALAQSGNHGSLSWSISDSVLTISGTGNMEELDYYTPYPWGSYQAIIKTVKIGNGVTSVAANAFGNYDSPFDKITFVDMPSVKTIGYGAFQYCSNLASVNMPKVEIISSTAFWDCGLTSVTIPETLTTLGESIFMNCSSLKTVNYNAINCTETNYMSMTPFFGCSNITAINIGNKVTTLPFGIFYGVPLASVNIPGNVKVIGSEVFSFSKLTSITIPNGVTTIGERAFYACGSLKSVSIPNTVTSIGYWAFGYCEKLDTVKVFWDEPLLLEYEGPDSPFEVSLSCVLSVPKGTKAAYQNAPHWKDFSNIVERESILEDKIEFEYKEHSVTITWQPIANAFGYILIVYSDPACTIPICTIRFDKDGMMITSFKAGGEDFKYTVDNLLGNAKYYYKLSAVDASDEVLDATTGSFVTLGTTDVAKTATDKLIVYSNNHSIVVENAENQPIKIIDITGKMVANKMGGSTVEQFCVPNQGVYVVIVGNKAQKVLVP